MFSAENSEKLAQIFESAISGEPSDAQSVAEAWNFLLETLTDAPLLKALLEDLRISDHWAHPDYYLFHFITSKDAADWWSTSMQDPAFDWYLDVVGERQETAEEQLEEIEAEISDFFVGEKFSELSVTLFEKLTS